jgi:hypothetical protein
MLVNATSPGSPVDHRSYDLQFCVTPNASSSFAGDRGAATRAGFTTFPIIASALHTVHIFFGGQLPLQLL